MDSVGAWFVRREPGSSFPFDKHHIGRRREAEEPFSGIHVGSRSIKFHPRVGLRFPPRTFNPSVSHSERPDPIVSTWLRSHQLPIPQREQIPSPNAKPYDARFVIFSTSSYQLRPPAVNMRHQGVTTYLLPEGGVRENFCPDLVSCDLDIRVLRPWFLATAAVWALRTHATPSPHYHQTFNVGYTFISLSLEWMDSHRTERPCDASAFFRY